MIWYRCFDKAIIKKEKEEDATKIELELGQESLKNRGFMKSDMSIRSPFKAIPSRLIQKTNTVKNAIQIINYNNKINNYSLTPKYAHSSRSINLKDQNGPENKKFFISKKWEYKLAYKYIWILPN